MASRGRQRAAFCGRDGGAADKGREIGDGIGRKHGRARLLFFVACLADRQGPVTGLRHMMASLTRIPEVRTGLAFS